MTTFKKLRNGSWGVRGTGPAPEPGVLLTVAKRSGGEGQVTIARVLWTGQDAWLATIERERRAPRVRTFDEYERLEDQPSTLRYEDQYFGEN